MGGTSTNVNVDENMGNTRRSGGMGVNGNVTMGVSDNAMDVEIAHINSNTHSQAHVPQDNSQMQFAQTMFLQTQPNAQKYPSQNQTYVRTHSPSQPPPSQVLSVMNERGAQDLKDSSDNQFQHQISYEGDGSISVDSSYKHTLVTQGGDDKSQVSLAHSTSDLPPMRSTDTITWLQDNYVVAMHISIPRNLLHTHYSEFALSRGFCPANVASFGKIIRSIFPDLKTRRLGTRGKSKYHYYGIKAKDTSPYQYVYRRGGIVGENQSRNEGSEAESGQTPPRIDEHRHIDDSSHSQSVPPEALPERDPETIAVESLSFNISYPPIVWTSVLCESPDKAVTAQSLLKSYINHLTETLQAVIKCNFSVIEKLWRDFWGELSQQHKSVVDTEQVIDAIVLYDLIFFQKIISLLIPNIIMPVTPKLAASIRDFAKHIENWMRSAMIDLPRTLINRRIDLASVWSSCIRGNTSVNHLAQAARAVLANPDTTQQMIMDWGRIDFMDIEGQVHWTYGDIGVLMLRKIRDGFGEQIGNEKELETFVVWVKEVVGAEKCTLSTPSELKWRADVLSENLLHMSFIIQLIIRDLTLRSAASFGNFHLFSLLLNEYALCMVDTAKLLQKAALLCGRLSLNLDVTGLQQ
eukprot:CFRG7493T1